MLRYDRQTKPGLVALYDIRPGNGVGLYLQPRSPHGAYIMQACNTICTFLCSCLYHKHTCLTILTAAVIATASDRQQHCSQSLPITQNI